MRFDDAHYSFIFSDIKDEPSTIKVSSPYSFKSLQCAISVQDGQLLHRRQSEMSPLVADLVDLGIAISVADRIAIRQQRHQGRSLHLQIPLRHPEVFASTNISSLLREILHHYSNDEWDFDFTLRASKGRPAEIQACLYGVREPAEVALWSGGLDSLAGLYNRLNVQSAPPYTLVNSGSNLTMQGVQKRTAHLIQRKFPKVNITTEQVPFRLYKPRGMLLNHTPRIRGFLFLLMGAACASLEGQQTLHIYENGVGAINLPFESSIGLDHSRAVHPISLCYMSELLSAILQGPFSFCNPFLFTTKAQMCKQLVQDREYELINATVSCDRRRRATIIQCGRCSSCLLRRQALLANGVDDGPYFITSERKQGRQANENDGAYLRAMLRQVGNIQNCVADADPWGALARKYPDLSSVSHWLAATNQGEPQKIQNELVQLYRQYVTEWSAPGVRKGLSQYLLLDEEIESFV